jgi:hypothetical protein
VLFRSWIADWVNTADATKIVPTLGNTRLLINQNGGVIAGAGLTDTDIENGFGTVKSYGLGNTYSDQTPGPIDISSIDNSSAPGRQVQFDVFVKLPITTVPGFYTTGFGIESLVPSLAPPPTLDTTPPEVLSSYPTDNSINVPVDIQPTLTFSEALNPSTINGGIELRDYDTNTKVTATLSLSVGDTVVTFHPTSLLSPNKQYFFFVGTGVKDVAGNSFAAGTWYYAQRSSHEFTTTP